MGTTERTSSPASGSSVMDKVDQDGSQYELEESEKISDDYKFVAVMNHRSAQFVVV